MVARELKTWRHLAALFQASFRAWTSQLWFPETKTKGRGGIEAEGFYLGAVGAQGSWHLGAPRHGGAHLGSASALPTKSVCTRMPWFGVGRLQLQNSFELRAMAQLSER